MVAIWKNDVVLYKHQEEIGKVPEVSSWFINSGSFSNVSFFFNKKIGLFHTRSNYEVPCQLRTHYTEQWSSRLVC